MSGNIDRYGRARTPQNVVPHMPVYHSPSYTRSNTNVSYVETPWDKFNDFFAGIGDWFQDSYETIEEFIQEKVVPVLITLAAIGVVIGAVVTWINEGFWSFFWYVLAALFLGGIIAYLSFYALVVFLFILRIFLLILRFVFTNAVSFFATVLVVAGIVIGTSVWSPSHRAESKAVATSSAYKTYYCKASSLNVRSYASTTAPIIGKLKRGDSIKVYSINNGFAKIDYKGRTGYVSEKYIVVYQ